MKTAHLPPFKKTIIWVLLFLGLGGTVNTLTAAFDILLWNQDVPLYFAPLWEFSGAFATLPIYPLAYIAFQKIPIIRPQLWSKIVLHLVLAFVFSVMTTSLFIGIRVVIYRSFNMGDYLIGDLAFRYLYEFTKFIFFYAVSYVLLRVVQINSEKQALEKRAAELKSAHDQAQILALKSQINPHFLFNTLNAISSVMYESIEKADRMMALLSDLLRKSLGLQNTVTFAEELETLQSYLNIMKARMGDRMLVKIPDDLLGLDQMMPSFCLQPLVENAIKYHPGLAEDKVEIVIGSSKKNGYWFCYVEDNGGATCDQVKKGLGLSYVEERLKTFSEQARMECSNAKDGLRIELHFKEST